MTDCKFKSSKQNIGVCEKCGKTLLWHKEEEKLNLLNPDEKTN